MYASVLLKKYKSSNQPIEFWFHNRNDEPYLNIPEIGKFGMSGKLLRKSLTSQQNEYPRTRSRWYQVNQLTWNVNFPLKYWNENRSKIDDRMLLHYRWANVSTSNILSGWCGRLIRIIQSNKGNASSRNWIIDNFPKHTWCRHSSGSSQIQINVIIVYIFKCGPTLKPVKQLSGSPSTETVLCSMLHMCRYSNPNPYWFEPQNYGHHFPKHSNCYR